MIRLAKIVGAVVVICAFFVGTKAAPQRVPANDLNSQTLQTAVSHQSTGVAAYPFHQPITSGAITLYQKLISPARGTFCPMRGRRWP